MSQRYSKFWLLVVTVVASGLLYHALNAARPPVAKTAYIVREEKAGFLLVWKNSDSEFQTQLFNTLNETVAFATRKLHLEIKRSGYSTLEFVSVERRFGNFVLVWKEESDAFLHQMTFQNEFDAEYFRKAFWSGAYTPSPFGHAVAFHAKRPSANLLKILSTSFK